MDSIRDHSTTSSHSYPIQEIHKYGMLLISNMNRDLIQQHPYYSWKMKNGCCFGMWMEYEYPTSKSLRFIPSFPKQLRSQVASKEANGVPVQPAIPWLLREMLGSLGRVGTEVAKCAWHIGLRNAYVYRIYIIYIYIIYYMLYIMYYILYIIYYI